MKKIFAIILAASLAMLTLASCGEKKYATKVADIKTNGELIIGLDDTFAPMGFREANGDLVGFDIDLANAVCAKLGVKASFKPIDWNAKEMELTSGNIDCIWNGMSINPKRQKEMSLTKAYLNNRIVIMTNVGIEIADKKSLVNYNIGIQAGSAALDAVKADEVYNDVQNKIVEYPTYDEVIMDMTTGRLDCMIIDEVFGGYKNSKMGSVFSVSDINFGDDLYAVGFRKGDKELTDEVNKILDELKADGTTVEISNKWFAADITA